MTTKIEWTHRPGTKGETWNPVIGCQHARGGAMKSIEFSAPMMAALLRGEKTMTRRRMKPQPELVGGLWRWKDTAWCEGRSLVSEKAPVDYARYQPGDILYVKEPLVRHICPHLEYSTPGAARGLVVYDADNNRVHPRMLWRWARSTLPARHCPREASRATVRITSVQVERVQEITEGDEWVWVYEFEVVP